MTLDIAAAEAAESSLSPSDSASRPRKAAHPSVVVERKALLAAAERAAKVAASRTTIPILGAARIEAASGVLSVLCTDTDAWLTVRVEGVDGSLPACCPPADKLAAAVKAARGEHVTLELRSGKLVLRHDGGRQELPVLPAVEFPAVESLRGSNEAASLRLDGELFRARLATIEPFASTEETRYYLTGLHIVRTDTGHLAVSATDGHRLVRATIAPAEDDGSRIEAIIPRATVKLLAKLPGDALTVRVDSRRIEVEGDGVTLGSRLIDATFPEVDRVIPPQCDENLRASFAVADLVAGLEQVKWAAEQEGRTRTVGLHIPTSSDHAIFWTGRGDDASRAVAKVRCEDAGSSLSVGFQVPYFADLCAYAEAAGATRLRLESAGPQAPMRWFMDDLPDQLVLMPMRIGAYQPAEEDEA